MTSSWVFRIGVAIVILAVLGGIAAGVARGWDDDHERTIEYRVVDSNGQTIPGAESPVVVLQQDRDFGPRGFFPVFPLVILGGVLIVIGIVSTRHGGPRGGAWGRSLEDWHRDLHSREATPGNNQG